MPLSPDARIAILRPRLERLRDALLQASPDSIEQALPALAEAADELELFSEEMSKSPPLAERERDRLLGQLVAMRVDLARLALLDAHGLEFCKRWSQILQSAAGYLPSGEAAQIAQSGSILIRG